MATSTPKGRTILKSVFPLANTLDELVTRKLLHNHAPHFLSEHVLVLRAPLALERQPVLLLKVHGPVLEKIRREEGRRRGVHRVSGHIEQWLLLRLLLLHYVPHAFLRLHLRVTAPVNAVGKTLIDIRILSSCHFVVLRTRLVRRGKVVFGEHPLIGFCGRGLRFDPGTERGISEEFEKS